ncbi:hypothetical protein DCAR_0728592 [Daucus carota subsp. sativus]|uniref:Uncharacterized protein n=1 Tax=Daucus carota subsp. sativus TaxID=79200 RepID=A0A164TPI8_DAUCS|nr:hypothetical protein DCAR_0728592 [Daucus carota subsp. sativus]
MKYCLEKKLNNQSKWLTPRSYEATNTNTITEHSKLKTIICRQTNPIANSFEDIKTKIER